MFLRQLLIFSNFCTLWFHVILTKTVKLSLHQPKLKAQWLNPLFYNNDFENELNFPLMV
jgi:hypothetical protein